VPAILLAVLLVGCNLLNTTPTPPPSTEPTSEESLGEESSPAGPTPLPCDPGFVCSGTLEPGDYTSTSIGPTISFTLDEGWRGDEDTPGAGFALLRTGIPGSHAMSVVSYSGEIFDEVCDPSQTSTIGASPAEFVDWLAGVEGVNAEAPVETEVGGRPAVQLDLTTESPCTEPDRMWLWVVPVFGDFHFNDGETARVFAVDGGTATVIIVIEAYPNADFAQVLEAAETVLATMTIQAAAP
jgi:hypothetical protein